MNSSPPDFDLWKRARKLSERALKTLKAADTKPLGDQQRILMLQQAAQDMRAFAYELEKNVQAERDYNARGVSFYNVSMFDDSAEPVLVG